MMKQLFLASVFGILINSPTVQADLASAFDSDQEGWRFANDVYPLVWKSEGGNPGGFIEGEDIGDGRTWYFVSPESWKGDWSKYKKLSFDLKQVGNGSGFDSDDLIIVGNNGQSLFWKGEREPAENWTSYSISLDPSTFKATRAKYNSIIKNIDKIMIRGEFISGNDIGGLDNVGVSETPEAVHGSTLGLGRYNVVCQNTKTHQAVKLAGNVKLDWDCEAMGLIVNDGDPVSITIKGNAAK
ncbi:MAG: laminin B domain-containing protein [Methylovulum sp.]|nr:laminin B domain-containing protein [Methylovulum sp.]